MLFKEIIAVFSENRAVQDSQIQNAQLMSVK
jgi:hypothetical protein